MKLYSMLNKKSRMIVKKMESICEIEYIHYVRYFFRRLGKTTTVHSLKKDKQLYYYQTVQNLLHLIMSLLESQYTLLGVSFYNINDSRELRKLIKNKYPRKIEKMYKELLLKTVGVDPNVTKNILKHYNYQNIRKFYIMDYCIIPRKQISLARKIILNSQANYKPLSEILNNL